MNTLTIEEKAAVEKALLSQALQNLIGAEEWDLSEEEENHLWTAISKVESCQ
jgi:hypothetical protein